MKTVLFVCVHNAGRSQMAAGFMKELGAGKVEVLSAGSAPKDSINPIAVEAIPARTGQLRPPWQQALAQAIPVRREFGAA